MNQMISLPIGGYPFATQEGRQQNSLAVGGRPADYFRSDDTIHHDGDHVYSLHDQPNVGANVPHQASAGCSYHQEHLLSDAGTTSSEYGAPATSSLSALANYSGLTTTPLPAPAGLATHYTSAPQTYSLSNGYAQAFNAPPSMRMSSMADHHQPSEIMQAGRPYGLSNTISPAAHDASRRHNYTTAIPDRSSSLHSPLQRRHEMAVPKTPSYNLTDQTPRTIYSPMSMSPQQSTLYSTAYNAGLASPDTATNVPPFSEQKNFCDLWGGLDNIRKKVSPTINCRIEKGFFQSNDGCYTCYRRNYFSVSCDYNLSPLLINEPLYVTKDSSTFQVQALAMCLSAAVDGPNGKKIDLVQYTPKRDAGDKSDVTMRKVLPMPAGGPRTGHGDTYPFPYPHSIVPGQRGPLLPLQQLGSEVEAGQLPGQSTSSNCTTTFERVQFKSATANNGKRRAQQQYYHITVELWADIRKSPKESEAWVKIAQRTSEPVVVRGRSPSHYKNEGTHGSADFRGAGGAGGSGSGLGNYTYASNTSHAGRSYSLSGSGGGHSSLGGSYRLSSGVEQSSHVDSSPTSSTSSLDASPAASMSLTTGLGLNNYSQFGQPLQRSNTYEYFPGPLNSGYDGTYAKSDGDLTRPLKNESYGPVDASNSTLPSACGRFVKPALSSSRGYYSRVTNGY